MFSDSEVRTSGWSGSNADYGEGPSSLSTRHGEGSEGTVIVDSTGSGGVSANYLPSPFFFFRKQSFSHADCVSCAFVCSRNYAHFTFQTEIGASDGSLGGRSPVGSQGGHTWDRNRWNMSTIRGPNAQVRMFTDFCCFLLLPVSCMTILLIVTLFLVGKHELVIAP